MSTPIESPALHIPREHQSSPKKTDAEREIEKAAEEIVERGWRPELTENIFGEKEDEFWNTGISGILAAHPRVQDALRVLESQASDHTSPEFVEKAEMLHELNTMLRRGYKWDGQTRWQGKQNEEMRAVNAMSPRRFIEKLQAAGISAAIAPLVEDKLEMDGQGVLQWFNKETSPAKICLGNGVARGCVAVHAWVNGTYRYINRLEVPNGYEWTLMRFDEYDVPTNERRHGWRTAVLALIRFGVITEEQAHKAFGAPVLNEASAFYYQQLQELRNGIGRCR